MADQLPRVQHSRQPHDTADWCAERAAADRLAASEAENDNVRQRYELSAESWSARAEMLQRIADNIQARTDAVRAGADPEDEDLLPGYPA